MLSTMHRSIQVVGVFTGLLRSEGIKQETRQQRLPLSWLPIVLYLPLFKLSSLYFVFVSTSVSGVVHILKKKERRFFYVSLS